MLTLESFEEASEIVKKVTQETKLIKSSYFSDLTGNKVYLKPENMQRTGAYKVRGAYYKISTLTDEERAKGLIAASAGNHAQGVAYAAHKFGAKAVIVMPTTTPLIKVERTKSYGAEVILKGDVYDEACAYALELAEKEGYTFIHPFDDPAVATGQGTIAMEIVQELPLVDYILVPIGGGGLATGVSTLAKLLNPHIKVIGVEPSGAACMKASLEKGEVVTLPHVNTIADGTAVQTPGEHIFPYLQENLDDVITVSNEAITSLMSGSSICGLKPGDSLTLDQALYGLMLCSGNDAANAIAEHISGSVEKFAELMNQEAAALGASQSHFVNAHGLPDENHYTTAYDLYLIFNAAVQNDHFVKLISTKKYDASYMDASGAPVNVTWFNTNGYLKGTFSMPENVTVIGGKTGTTEAAGSCLVLYSKNSSGKPYISVVLKGNSKRELYTLMTELLTNFSKE